MEQMKDAPRQSCKKCESELTYTGSNTARTGREGDWERFDYYECPKACGKYQYRHADKQLREVFDQPSRDLS